MFQIGLDRWRLLSPKAIGARPVQVRYRFRLQAISDFFHAPALTIVVEVRFFYEE
jgi:hypothetical protein